MGIVEFAGAISPILIGVSTYIINKKIDKREKQIEARTEVRLQESHLQMELLLANTKLTETIGVCLKKNKFNGELKEASEYCEETKRKYKKFIKDQANKKINETI